MITDEKLYKAWWLALAYGAGSLKRMETIDKLRKSNGRLAQ